MKTPVIKKSTVKMSLSRGVWWSSSDILRPQPLLLFLKWYFNKKKSKFCHHLFTLTPFLNHVWHSFFCRTYKKLFWDGSQWKKNCSDSNIPQKKTSLKGLEQQEGWVNDWHNFLFWVAYHFKTLRHELFLRSLSDKQQAGSHFAI